MHKIIKVIKGIYSMIIDDDSAECPTCDGYGATQFAGGCLDCDETGFVSPISRLLYLYQTQRLNEAIIKAFVAHSHTTNKEP